MNGKRKSREESRFFLYEVEKIRVILQAGGKDGTGILKGSGFDNGANHRRICSFIPVLHRGPGFGDQ